MDLNGLSNEKVRKALGPRGTQELVDLHKWLYEVTRGGEPEKNWTGRMAPSIITRSEAELFSLSMPRFALRVYLDGDQGSFVNCRRIGEFCDQARKWGKRSSRKDMGKGRLGHVRARALAQLQRPAWALRKNSCIADCLLDLPRRVRRWQGFTTIKTALGGAYGESTNLAGTPYVRQIRLSGGGLCAQSACFMATALLHDHTKGVWGVADITALAAPSERRPAPGFPSSDPREYLLEGLTQRGVVEYFLCDYVKLNAVWMQSIPGGPRPSEGSGSPTQRIKLRYETKPLAHAMKAYIASSCPIILPLDMGRMAGIGSERCPMFCTSIFETNELKPENFIADPHEQRARKHAVVAVGYGREERDKDTDIFLLNDPASRPFLEADAGQIGESSFYTSDDLSDVMYGRFLAITPEEVKLPLVSWRPHTELNRPEPYPGLLRIAMVLQSPHDPQVGKDLPKGWFAETGSRFRLSKVDKIVTGPLDSDALDDQVREGLQKCTADLKRRFGPEHWCWTQVADTSIWAWNAEKALPAKDSVSADLARRYLMAVWRLDPEGWQCAYAADETSTGDNRLAAARPDALPGKDAAEGPALGSCADRPNRSLVSSFAAKGVRAAMENWPAGLEHGDIYCFMQDEAEERLPARALGLRLAALDQKIRWVSLAKLWDLPRRRGWQLFTNKKRRRGHLTHLEAWKRQVKSFEVWREPITTALERLSAGANDMRQVRDVCAWLGDCAEAKGVRVLGLATYFPEVQADGAKGRRATSALRFLTRLCTGLQDRGHPANTIEIVSGGLIQGVWPAKWRRGRYDEAGAPPDPFERKQPLYVATSVSTSQGIRRLLSRIRPLREEALDASVNFAVELEPGPLYVVRDWRSLLLLCRLLETRRDEGGFDDLSEIVGLNLDCAHYRMAQITSGMILAEPRIRDRILHVHLADHGQGHFGDVALGRIHSEAYFADWLRLVPVFFRERAPHLPKFRGGVSVEMEACRSSREVSESVATLERLVAGIP